MERCSGSKAPFSIAISSKVVELMRGAYPELMETQNFVAKVIRNEEERFSETLDSGLKILREELERLKKEEEEDPFRRGGLSPL